MSMSRGRKNIDRYEKIKQLRAKGYKFQEIADDLGVSRQRVWQIYSRIMQNSVTVDRSTRTLKIKRIA